VALLTVPALTLVILSVLTVTTSREFAPGFLIVGLGAGLAAGIIEELGWTGFALPRLLHRYNALLAGLILGLVWAGWHAFADLLGNSHTMGEGWLVHFVIYWILALTAYRILMTWVYANTKSLLVAQLMHASYTGWQIVLSPATTFENNLLWQGILAAGLWIIVALVVAVNGTGLVRRRITPAVRPV
jgi:membrane protease YdiL (CAAX protease family)